MTFKQWKKEQASYCCTADVCPRWCVNQSYTNQLWPKFYFFPLPGDFSSISLDSGRVHRRDNEARVHDRGGCEPRRGRQVPQGHPAVQLQRHLPRLKGRQGSLRKQGSDAGWLGAALEAQSRGEHHPKNQIYFGSASNIGFSGNTFTAWKVYLFCDLLQLLANWLLRLLEHSFAKSSPHLLHNLINYGIFPHEKGKLQTLLHHSSISSPLPLLSRVEFAGSACKNNIIACKRIVDDLKPILFLFFLGKESSFSFREAEMPRNLIVDQ